MSEASEHPADGQSNPARRDSVEWPLNTVLVSHAHRVLFTPISKNANSSLKRLFVRLSGHADRERILEEDIHRCLAQDATGLVLGDHPAEEVAKILADPSWFHFTVLRNPVERAVSAYLNKFVVVPPPRGADGKPIEIAPTVDWVYGQRQEAPDYDRAISFAEFVEAVVSNPDDSLDTHFKSQHAFLRGQRIDALFAVEDLAALMPVLTERFGAHEALEHYNRRQVRKPLFSRRAWSSLLPAELQKHRPLPPARYFANADTRDRLEQRFAEDLALWNQAVAHPGAGP